MIVPGSASPLMWGQGDPLDELGKIDRSLRFRRSANARLSKTFGVAGNRKTWVWHGWVKRGILSGQRSGLFGILSTGTYNGYLNTYFAFEADDRLRFGSTDAAGADQIMFQSNRQFRDTNSHLPVTLAIDTNQASAAAGIRCYVGNELLTFASSAWLQNLQMYINTAQTHYIGQSKGNSGTTNEDYYSDCLFSNVTFIDGYPSGVNAGNWTTTDFSALFLQVNQRTGQVRPRRKADIKASIDAGGANSFFLPFDDPTNTTTLCADTSSKGNNWTANNISLTSGATYDSLLDTPTNNFCTLNPLDKTAGAGSLSDGNLTFSYSSTGTICRATMSAAAGKLWAEGKVSAIGTQVMFGLAKSNDDPSSTANSIFYRSDGQKFVNGVAAAYGASYTTNDVIAIAADFDAGTVTFYKQTGGTGAFVSQGAISYGLSSGFAFATYNAASSVVNMNFGQQGFGYVAQHGALPTGFKAQNTKNLSINYPVMKGENAFVARSGTGANIVATLSAASAWSDWIRIYKRRDSAEGWRWQFSDDSSYYMDSSSTAAKAAFPSLSGTSYVGYALKVGAGNGIATGRLTHVNGVADVIADDLGKSRKVVILKNEATGNWFFYHPDLTAGYLLYMNLQQVETSDATISAVNSSGFTVAAALASGTYRWIAIAETSGLIKLGSYIDNASADGPFGIGDSPAFAFFKYKSAGTCDWMTYDTARSPGNVMAASLRLNSTAAEGTRNDLDSLSNGLKVRSTIATSDSINFTGAGGTHVYVSFAAFPFRYANAR